MYKASDLAKGKMNEVFKQAYIEPVELNHKSFGKFELMNSIHIDGLATVAMNILCGHVVLCEVEGGYSWLEPHDAAQTNDTNKEIAQLAVSIQDDKHSITETGIELISPFIGKAFNTKLEAIDTMLAAFYGFKSESISRVP